MQMKDFKYLDNLIHSGFAEIMLKSDIILAEGEESIYGEGIKLDMEKVTIDGKGHTIDAKSLAGIFHSNSKGITLRNITFKNASCAIYNDEGEMRMENCSFIDLQGQDGHKQMQIHPKHRQDGGRNMQL